MTAEIHDSSAERVPPAAARETETAPAGSRALPGLLAVVAAALFAVLHGAAVAAASAGDFATATVLAWTVIVGTIATLLLGACSAVEASVVSAFGHGGPESGIVLGIFALGSLVGGLSLGQLPVGPWSMARRMFAVFVGLALAVASLQFWWLAIALLIAGVGIAPVFAVMSSIVSVSVKFSDTAEAYGWVGTGQLIGAALGSALAGFFIDANGASGGFWVSAGFALVGFLLPTVLKSWHPDLRGRDSSPIPDTEPIHTQPS